MNKSRLRRWTLKRSLDFWKEERVIKALDLETIFLKFERRTQSLRHWTFEWFQAIFMDKSLFFVNFNFDSTYLLSNLLKDNLQSKWRVKTLLHID